MADQIDLSPLLAQISADVLIDELRRRLGLAAANGDAANATQTFGGAPVGNRDTGTPGQVRPAEFFRLSIPEAVKKFLEIAKRPQNPKVIVEALEAGGLLSNAKNFYQTVWSELKRMEGKGILVNTPAGWAPADWFPAKPKGGEIAKPKKKKKRAASKALSAPSAAPFKSPAEKPLTWRLFLAQRLKAGKSMQDASSEWRARKNG